MKLIWTTILLVALCVSAVIATDKAPATEGEAMIQGMRTVVYPVTDLEKAKTWYTDVLGFGPYFDEPFYAGYAVGGFELGLMPEGEPGSRGAIAYWGVPNAEAALARLQKLGAPVKEPLTDVGGGIKVATVFDPFGNVFGIIENPHFKLEDVR
jgi:predicted enzyme related to lactoylglutathione lyase